MQLKTIALTLCSYVDLFYSIVNTSPVDFQTNTTQSSNTTTLIPRTPGGIWNTPGGINCKGSALCWRGKGGPNQLYLQATMSEVDDERIFQNGEHIVCNHISWRDPNGIDTCVFLQKLPDGHPGESGTRVKMLFDMLVEHGCEMCGSIPIRYPDGINDYEQGELTINAVYNKRHGCDLVCE